MLPKTASIMRQLSFDGRIEPISAGEGQSVSEISVTSTEAGAMVHIVSWTTSPRWLRYDAQRRTASDTGIQPPLPIDPSAISYFFITGLPCPIFPGAEESGAVV